MQPVAIPEEDEEEDQEQEAIVKLMLIVLGEEAIKGFHQQVIATMHASQTCKLTDIQDTRMYAHPLRSAYHAEDAHAAQLQCTSDTSSFLCT